jgi:hypothetical protein
LGNAGSTPGRCSSWIELQHLLSDGDQLLLLGSTRTHRCEVLTIVNPQLKLQAMRPEMRTRSKTSSLPQKRRATPLPPNPDAIELTGIALNYLLAELLVTCEEGFQLRAGLSLNNGRKAGWTFDSVLAAGPPRLGYPLSDAAIRSRASAFLRITGLAWSKAVSRQSELL